MKKKRSTVKETPSVTGFLEKCLWGVFVCLSPPPFVFVLQGWFLLFYSISHSNVEDAKSRESFLQGDSRFLWDQFANPNGQDLELLCGIDGRTEAFGSDLVAAADVNVLEQRARLGEPEQERVCDRWPADVQANDLRQLLRDFVDASEDGGTVGDVERDEGRTRREELCQRRIRCLRVGNAEVDELLAALRQLRRAVAVVRRPRRVQRHQSGKVVPDALDDARRDGPAVADVQVLECRIFREDLVQDSLRRRRSPRCFIFWVVTVRGDSKSGRE